MSDDMGEKVKQIAELLGQNSNANIPENVKGILNMLMSPGDSKGEDHKSGTDDKASKTETDEIADMTRKMKKAVNMLNTSSDSRVTLLNALKPYLNKNRQKKLQTAMKLIKIGSMAKLMDDLEERSV